MSSLRRCAALAMTVAVPLAFEGYTSSAAPFAITEFIERSGVSGVAISPDGSELLYTIAKADLSRNSLSSNLRTLAIEERKESELPIDGGDAYEWMPDSSSFLYVTTHGDIHRWDLHTASDHTLLAASTLCNLFPNCHSVNVSEIHVDPAGTLAALVVVVTGRADEHPSQGVEVQRGWNLAPNVALPSVVSAPTTTTLIRLNLLSNEVSRLVSEELEVMKVWGHSIDWSPDSREIVFSASKGSNIRRETSYMWSDLYIVGIDGHVPRLLLSQPGFDLQPYWSPDGKTIAFKTLAGKMDWRYNSQVGLVDLRGHHARYWAPTFAMSSNPKARSVRLGGWSHDSKEFYFVAPVRGHFGLYSIDAETGTLRDVAVPEGFDVGGDTAPPLVSARNADILVVQGSDFNHVPDLFAWRRSSGTLEQITQLNPELNDRPFSRTETVTWPSSDGKWRLQGFLLTPVDGGAGPWPLIVDVVGGPIMGDSLEVVAPNSEVGGIFPWPEFLKRGYALFIPNTRGRPGFGESFANAFDAEHSMNRVPSTDIISGVEHLIRQGRVDPRRIGIAAHSYGGGVAAYALARSNLFRAASIHEAVFLNPVDRYSSAPNAIAWAHMYGASSPFDPSIWPRLLRDSPSERVGSIKTPTLLEFGIESEAQSQGRPFFEALQLNHVPSELVVYPRTAHNTSEPELIADSYRRNLEWFDFWLKGIASDRMLERYGPARNLRGN